MTDACRDPFEYLPDEGSQLNASRFFGTRPADSGKTGEETLGHAASGTHSWIGSAAAAAVAVRGRLYAGGC